LRLITISGSTVVSTGNYLAAGIGCGQFGTCGDITIGGVVKAQEYFNGMYSYTYPEE